MKILLRTRIVKSVLHTLGQVITKQLNQWPSYIHWRCTVKNVESKMTPLFQKKLSNQLMICLKIINRIHANTDITHVYTIKAVASKALQTITEWSGILGQPPEDV